MASKIRYFGTLLSCSAVMTTVTRFDIMYDNHYTWLEFFKEVGLGTFLGCPLVIAIYIACKWGFED